MRVRIIGVASQKEKFDFFFGVELGRRCLSTVEKCFTIASSSNVCRSRNCEETVQSLQSIERDENFDLLWKYLEHRCSEIDLSTPTLPRLHFHAYTSML